MLLPPISVCCMYPRVSVCVNFADHGLDGRRHFVSKHPRSSTPAASTSSRTPVSMLPTSSATPTNAYGIMDPHATADYMDENYYPNGNQDNDADADNIAYSLGTD